MGVWFLFLQSQALLEPLLPNFPPWDWLWWWTVILQVKEENQNIIWFYILKRIPCHGIISSLVLTLKDIQIIFFHSFYFFCSRRLLSVNFRGLGRNWPLIWKCTWPLHQCRCHQAFLGTYLRYVDVDYIKFIENFTIWHGLLKADSTSKKICTNRYTSSQDLFKK